LTFETPSSTEWSKRSSEHVFCPTEYSNITDFIDQKLEVIKVYEDELRTYPHPRSLEAIRILSQQRGVEVGYHNAEAFEVVRNLQD